MAQSAPQAARWVMTAGFAVLLVAVIWWLAYYGQWQGTFGLLDVKLGCLVGDAFECGNFRDFIGQSGIPVYSPVASYVGLGILLVGIVLAWRRRS